MTGVIRKAGLLVNPGSGRGSGKGKRLVQKLHADPHVEIAVLNSFQELVPALRKFDKVGVTDLFISSGDGTVQAIQTLLAETDIFKTTPRLALLPHGTTNMTANSIGVKTHLLTKQVKLISGLHVTQTTNRATLKISNTADGKIRHGMFLGSGAMTTAVRYTQDSFNDAGIKGALASLAVISKVVWSHITDKSQNDHRIDRPYALSVKVGDQLLGDGPHLMALCTTLDRLVLQSRPFWGDNSSHLRTTLFPYPVPNVLRWIIPTLYGSERRRMPQGCKSASGGPVFMTSESGFALDGEFFDGPKEGALRIELGPEFTYIRR